jgi:hypothetical protein
MFELAHPDKGRAGTGVLLAMGLYFGELILLFLIEDSVGSHMEHGFIFAVLGAPLVQSLYIVPLYFVWKRSGKSATANGLLGGAIALAVIYYLILGVMAFVG